jgi:hypothetical protein
MKKVTDEERTQWAKLYNDGTPIKKIAADTGRNQMVVRKALQKAGVQFRGGGASVSADEVKQWTNAFLAGENPVEKAGRTAQLVWRLVCFDLKTRLERLGK